MEHKKRVGLSLLVTMGTVLSLMAQAPATPINLQAEVEGCKVSLSWQRGDNNAILTHEGFEGEKFPSDGWEVQSFNTTDYRCSWFHYPTDDFKELDNWQYYIKEGESSAMVYMDMGYHEGIVYNQDERLISPIYNDAVYLDFWYYINPMILEYAQFSDFVDKYCVELSHDGGETWEVIWDARNHHNGLDDWQQVSLYLGEPTPNTRIAFHAQSDMENEWSTLYFSWTIDDVVISSNGSSSDAMHSTRQHTHRDISDSMQSYKVFNSNNSTSLNRRFAAQENDEPSSYYQVFLEGQLLADKLCSLSYIDISDKEAGTYTYEVKAVNEQGISEAATIQVTIAESTFNAPTNVQVTSEYYDEEGWGEVIITWDAPEGNRKPACYSIYVNGILAGVEIPLGEFGNTWVAKGVYTYEVAAVYEYPYGESQRIGDQVAMNTRYPARNLEAVVDNGIVTLSWQKAKESDFTVESYKVYRGNKEIANIPAGETLTYIDNENINGVYTYSVKASYSDGELSLPIQQNILVNDYAITELPYTQEFNGDLTPDNWMIEVLNEIDPMFNWRFDNWFEIATPCTEVKGNFASISSEANEFINLICSITTPIFDNTSIPEGESVILSCTMDYYSAWESSYVCVEISYDTGESWEWYADIYPEDITDYQYNIDITSAVENATPMFRIIYDGAGDGYMIIDNFKVYITDNLGVNKNHSEEIAISMIAGRQLLVSASSAIENVQIYNTNGMLVGAYNGNNLYRQIIELSHLHNGLYIVKVQCADNTFDAKIVIN
ncbi:MAG: T9SS type A sorting domain-containing protein [Bacteroidaceae bacterium]|nr:T9SS type A sorting domain-containing protein [Bacteroidaceae bacterium]